MALLHGALLQKALQQGRAVQGRFFGYQASGYHFGYQRKMVAKLEIATDGGHTIDAPR